MIMRISILALLFCSQLLWAEAATDRSWNFKVLINDREVGSHQFRVTGEGDSLSVSSTMNMDFKVLLVKKVRYQHQANEIWQGSCLTDVSSQTNRQGKAVSLKVKPVETGLLVEKDKMTEGAEVLAGCVRSFAYWDPQLLQGERLLNVETGEYMPVVISRRVSAEDNITHMIIAAPKGDIHLQYDAAGDWLSLQTKLKTGAELKYQRI